MFAQKEGYEDIAVIVEDQEFDWDIINEVENSFFQNKGVTLGKVIRFKKLVKG